MRNSKILKCFHIVRFVTSPSSLATLALFSFLLIPAHLLKKEDGHWIERIEFTDSKQVSELLEIYSVVKSQNANLSDGGAWQISHTILEESQRHSLDPMLVVALINVESSFQHGAVSTDGARGLMQIRPIAAHAVAKDQGSRELLDNYLNGSALDQLNLDDPILNIKLGVFYLHSLKKSFRDLKLALTAYNWGPTEVRNRLQEDEGLPLEYAMKVLSAYHSYRNDNSQRRKTP